MKTYQFDLSLIIDAKSKKEALERAENAMQNLREMIGYSPFECELEFHKDTCSEIEYEEEIGE